MPFQHLSHHVTSFLYEPRAMDSERWLSTHTKMVYYASHNNFPTVISSHSMCVWAAVAQVAPLRINPRLEFWMQVQTG